MSAIAAFVISALASELKVPAETLTLETSLRRDLAVDSLRLIELGLALEERFGLRIEERDFAQLDTIGDVVAFAEERAGLAAAGPSA